MIAGKLWCASPEIFLSSTACLLILFDAFFGKNKRQYTYLLSLIILLGTLLCIIYTSNNFLPELIFSKSFIFDKLGCVLKSFLVLIVALVFIYARRYLEQNKLPMGEFLVLGMFSLLGMMILVSAASFLTMYLGIELLALPIYVLIAISNDDNSLEAAVKYFILGAIASAIMLFGVSLIFGVTGNLLLIDVTSKMIDNSEAFNHVLTSGVIFVLVGLAFKLGAVPFHMWVPDIYEGSSNVVTSFISTAPKLAALGMAIRLIDNAFPALQLHWQTMFMLMAVLSLFIGNVVALAQTNLKRLLAYSTIGHVGFILAGLIGESSSMIGFSSTLFYTIVYSLTVLGVFAVIIVLNNNGDFQKISDLQGLARSQPSLALILLLLLLSLAGIPPMVGFYAKFLVLKSLISQGFIELAIFSLLMSVVGAFYYLRIIKTMYFDAPLETKSQKLCSEGAVNRVLLMGNGTFVLFFGLFPAPLLTICKLAF